MDRGTCTAIRNIAAAACIIGGLLICGGEPAAWMDFYQAVALKTIGLGVLLLGVHIMGGFGDAE